jgi:uncharacterized delta-60 repeat protein
MRWLRTGLLALGALVSITAPAAAHARAHLETHFGRHGIRYLPGSLREASGAALLGDGRVIVGGEHEVAALLPSGRFDPSFGKDGIARLVRLRGGPAYISEIAADPAGRPVVVGSTEGAPRLESFIERLTPAGQIDRSFGAGRGYLLSNFDIPAPSTGGAPSSFPESVDFDSAGRMLVTGRAATGTEPLPAKDGGGTGTKYEAFLARLDSAGQLDPSFAKGGSFVDEGINLLPGAWDVDQSVPRFWSPAPGSGVVVRASQGEAESVLRLRGDGSPDPAFGNEGYAPYPSGTYAGPLVDPEGQVVTWGYLEGVSHRQPNGIRIARLTPDGSSDLSFGTNGFVNLRIPRFYVGELALDEQGRILIAAQMKGRHSNEAKELALIRLRSDGKLDKSFGHGGIIRIPVPGGGHGASIYLGGIDVRGDQAVIGASYCGPCNPVVALVDLGAS